MTIIDIWAKSNSKKTKHIFDSFSDQHYMLHTDHITYICLLIKTTKELIKKANQVLEKRADQQKIRIRFLKNIFLYSNICDRF